MSLKNQIAKNMESAMKARDSARVKVLRFLYSAIKNKEIEIRPDPLADNHILGVLKKQIKQIKESLEHYKKAGYKQRAEEEEFQLSVLESYLPRQISEEQLRQIVHQAIAELKAQSIKDMGAVMKRAMAKAQGSADGKMLAEIARHELSKL